MLRGRGDAGFQPLKTLLPSNDYRPLLFNSKKRSVIKHRYSSALYFLGFASRTSSYTAAKIDSRFGFDQ